MTALHPAVQAFREETRATPVPFDGELTLRRILERTGRPHRRRLLVFAFAAFAAASAAALVGARWASRHPAHAAVSRPAPAPTAFPTAAPTTSPTSMLPLAAEPAGLPGVGTAPARPGKGARSLLPQVAAGAQPDGFQAEDDLFAQAQEEHDARTGSPGGSIEELSAWDRYLARYPQGRFGPEARYRRAVTLAKLRYWDQARAALTPFAEGVYGDYRREEAAEWLRSLPEP